MPIKTDYLYNRNTNDKVPAEALIYYDKEENSIKDIFDKVLIYLDDIKNLDVESIDSIISDYEKLIIDMQNEYDRIISYVNNFADVDTLKKYLDKIDEINKKINDTITDFKNKIKNIEDKESKIEKDEQDFEDEINSKCDILSGKVDKFIHPIKDNIIKKIIYLENYNGNYKGNNAYVYDGTILECKDCTKTIKVPRRALASNSIIKFEQKDTETTTYIELINPKTNEKRKFDTDSSSGNWSSYTFKSDLEFLLKNWDDDDLEIDVILHNYQDDRKGLRNLKIYREGDIIEPFNHIKGGVFIDTLAIDEYKSSFQAKSECDMYKGNYPYDNNKNYSSNNVGDVSAYRYYTNNNVAAFTIPRLKSGKYEFGVLTFDFETNEQMTATLTSKCVKVDLFSNTSMQPNDITEFKLVDNGKSLTYYTDEIDDDLKSQGWMLFCPRSKNEFNKARDYLKEIGRIGCVGPMGIYNTKSVDSSNKPLNSDNMGKDGWRVKDGSPCWWASDITSVTEPNGDYDAGAYLHFTYDENGDIKLYNDNHHNYTYTTYLVVKRKSNYKKKIIKSSDPSQKHKWKSFKVDLSGINENAILELWSNSPVGYYDFYFRDLNNDEIIVKKFGNDTNETIQTNLYHPISKLPITSIISKNSQTFFNVPKTFECGNDESGSCFTSFKPYNREFYEISFDMTASGSWDKEIMGVKLNDFKIFEDVIDFHNGYNDKNLKYRTPFVKFYDSGFVLSQWNLSQQKIISSGNDLLGKVKISMLLDKEQTLKFYNALDNDFNDENMYISNLKIERLDYEIIEDFYAGKWKLTNSKKNEEIISDNLSVLVLKNNELSFIKKLIKGNSYTLDLKVHFTDDNTNVTDLFKIFINDNKVFGDTLSLSDTKMTSSLNYIYTKSNLYHLQKNNITIKNLKKVENKSAHKKFNDNNFLTAIIRIKFISNGNDKIKIKTDIKTDNYIGIEHISIVDMKDFRGVISKNVSRIESGVCDKWEKYSGDDSLYMDIDTSKYNFSDNVRYFTSLQSNSGNWQAKGYTSIYKSSKNGFRIYLQYNGNALKVAKDNSWKILWTAVETF